MSREAHFFYDPNALGADGELPIDEAAHAIRVLRLSDGDEIYVMDGRGTFYRSHVAMHTRNRLLYVVDESVSQRRLWNGSVTLAIAPTKNIERMEWLMEKSTEIGIDRIVFLRTSLSERTTMRLDRIERVVASAMKQSRQPWKPQCEGISTFCDFMRSYVQNRATNSYAYIAHCYGEYERTSLTSELQQLPTDAAVTILIGPEGDFSIDEVSRATSEGFLPVSLGKSRLRTETAGLYAIMAFQMRNK